MNVLHRGKASEIRAVTKVLEGTTGYTRTTATKNGRSRRVTSRLNERNRSPVGLMHGEEE